MWDEECSIYRQFVDRKGRVGTLREFLFSEEARPQVERIREMVAEFGAEAAKKKAEYKKLKTNLPCACLSGVFSERVDKGLLRHSGYIALDIDLQDNKQVCSMEDVIFCLKFRPEVAGVFKSCSGTGLFAMVKLAYPDKHREQFQALVKEYDAMGITLDRQCINVSRLRYASWDPDPYIREKPVMPYKGIDLQDQVIVPKAAALQYRAPREYTANDTEAKVRKLVEKIESKSYDITQGRIDTRTGEVVDSYHDWIRIGFALSTLGETTGRELFHRVSRFNAGYNPKECDRKFDTLLHSNQIGIGFFFNVCTDHRIFLKDD